MFGNISALVNGNMFAGFFGNDLFVRLSEESRRELLDKKGASLLEPMKGKPMKEYVVIPKSLAEPTRNSPIVGHPVPGLDEWVASQEDKEIVHTDLVESILKDLDRR